MNQKVPIGNILVTFANSNATYVAVGMNANTYAYNTRASYLMNVFTSGDISTGVSLTVDGRLRLNTATDATRIFSVYNNDKHILSQDQTQLVSNANTVITETLYTKGYAEGSGYIIVGANGSITLDLNKGTNFFIDPRGHTLSNLTIIKPNNFVANRNRSLSAMMTVIDTANIANSFWTSAGVVWPYGRKPPDPVCAKLYSLLYSPNFPYNWFGFTSSLGANTGNSGLELSDGPQPETYWFMNAISGVGQYFYRDIGETKDKFNFDNNGNLYYFTGQISNFILGSFNTNTFVHRFGIYGRYDDENTEYRSMYSCDYDANNNMYLAGSKTDYGPVGGEYPFYLTKGLEVACLAKYDKNGNVIWERKDAQRNTGIDTNGQVIAPISYFVNSAVDSQGNICFIGFFRYYTGTSPNYTTNHGIMFVKYSNSGSVLDTKIFKLAEGSITGQYYVTKFDDTNHFYIYDDTFSGNNPKMLKMKNDGTIAWTKDLSFDINNGSNDGVFHVSKAGKIYFVANQFSMGVMNNSGTMLFSKTFSQRLEDITYDSLGNIYVLGRNSSPFYIIVYKFDQYGSLIWQIKISGTFRGYKISCDENDNVYVLGRNTSGPPYRLNFIKLPPGGNIVTGPYTLGSDSITLDYSNFTVTAGSLSVSDGSNNYVPGTALYTYNDEVSYATISNQIDPISHITLPTT